MTLTVQDDEFSRSLKLLGDLRDRCLDKGDEKGALQCIKECNKLQRFYAAERQRETESVQAIELMEIRGLLASVGVTGGEKTPVLELVRLLIYKIQEAGENQTPCSKHSTTKHDRQNKPAVRTKKTKSRRAKP